MIWIIYIYTIIGQNTYFDNLPIIFIGDGAGFVYSHLGTSHQSTEDIACTRAIPNLSVYSPSDRFELTQCFARAYEEEATVYIRLGKADRGDVHQSLQSLPSGGLINVRMGKKAKYSFIATGSMVRTAIDVADKLQIDIDVWSVPFIKPIDHSLVEKICSNSKGLNLFPLGLHWPNQLLNLRSNYFDR